MMHNRKNLLGPLVLLGVILLPASAWAADTKVAVIDTVQGSLSLKLNAQQAVAGALDEMGAGMVALENMITEDGACTESMCFRTIARRVGATHVILIGGVANPAGYRLSLDVRDGKTGRSLGTDGKDCELCAEDQFSTTLQQRVSKLWKRVMTEEARAKAAERSSGLEPVAEDTEARRPATPTYPWWTQRTPIMGMCFAAAGLVGIGFGAYYVAVDGDTLEMSQPPPPAKSNPIVVRDTGKWGWGFLGLGGVAVAAGAAMMIWGADDGRSAANDHRNVRVVVGPGSIGLQGKF
jgi:hypothetical protein